MCEAEARGGTWGGFILREDAAGRHGAQADVGSSEGALLERRHGHGEQAGLVVARRTVDDLNMDSVRRMPVTGPVIEGRIEHRPSGGGEEKGQTQNERASPTEARPTHGGEV